jgi:hypothetical protein
MRMMLKVQVPVEDGNNATKNRYMQSIIEETMQRIQPEAIYFFIEDGMRSAIAVFDMKDSSDMPAIAEPIFIALNADVQFTPVMTLDDFKQGLSRIG